MATPKPTILLIPGAWHTPECFDALRAEMEKHSFPTTSRQLPSNGCTDPSNHSAQTDADFIRTQLLLPLLDEGKRVVVAMHSYGGQPGSAAAYGLSEEERSKEGLKGGVVGLVYIAAFLVPAGLSCIDMKTPLLIGFEMKENGISTISPEGGVQNFYNDLKPTSEAQAWGSKLTSFVFNALNSSVNQTAHEQAAFNSRRSYIHCKKDAAIPLQWQKHFVAAAGIACVETLDTDHSPFLTMPERTAEILVEQISRFA